MSQDGITKSCPICSSRLNDQSGKTAKYVSYDCRRCGRFLVDFKLAATGWPSAYPEAKQIVHLLSGYSREKSDIATWTGLIGESQLAKFTADALPSIHRQFPKSIREKVHKLLLHLWRVTTYFGEVITQDASFDLSTSYSINPGEHYQIIELVKESGFLLHKSERLTVLALSASGFEEVERLRGSNLDSAKAFVAMPFDKGLRPLFDGPLSAGIAAAGYLPMRIDRKEHNDQIVDIMLAEIRESRFVVADFTYQSYGVYFEAGFAKGLGRPVIWTVRDDELERCHFDTRQYNFIEWKNGDDLAKRLNARIRATIGMGPREVSPEMTASLEQLTPEMSMQPTHKDFSAETIAAFEPFDRLKGIYQGCPNCATPARMFTYGACEDENESIIDRMQCPKCGWSEGHYRR